MDLALRLLAAVALGLVAFAHLDVADLYDAVGSPSLGALFRLQAAVAVVLAVLVLVLARRSPATGAVGRAASGRARLVWAATALFAAASLGALVWSRYRCLPLPGFDSCFQETWEAPRAVLSGVSETAALVLALAGLSRTSTSSRRVRTEVRGPRTPGR